MGRIDFRVAIRATRAIMFALATNVNTPTFLMELKTPSSRGWRLFRIWFTIPENQNGKENTAIPRS